MRSIRDNDGRRHNEILLIKAAANKRAGRLLGAERRRLSVLGVSQNEIDAISQRKMSLNGGGAVVSTADQTVCAIGGGDRTKGLKRILYGIGVAVTIHVTVHQFLKYAKKEEDDCVRRKLAVRNDPSLTKKEKEAACYELDELHLKILEARGTAVNIGIEAAEQYKSTISSLKARVDSVIWGAIRRIEGTRRLGQ